MSSDSPTLALLQQIKDDWARTGAALDTGPVDIRPIDTEPMLTLLLLSRLQAALTREIGRTYTPHGINAAGWDLLLTLYRSAPAGGLTPSELSRLAAISGPSSSNRIEKLLERGLVGRWPGEKDRRSVRVGLSDEGRRLVEALLPQHIRTAEWLLSGLSEAEQAQLRTLAARLVAHVEHVPSSGSNTDSD